MPLCLLSPAAKVLICTASMTSLWTSPITNTFFLTVMICAVMIPHCWSSEKHWNGDKKQAMRTQWFDQRAGHTAASTSYNVCHTSTDTPSLSLTRCICYPHDNQVIAPQLKYTRQNKASGLAKYKHLIKELHRDLRSHQAGLLIYEEFVFWEQLRFCWWSIAAVAAPVVPGTLRLKKKSHWYYYQIQVQLFVWKRGCCDFVVWNCNEVHV